MQIYKVLLCFMDLIQINVVYFSTFCLLSFAKSEETSSETNEIDPKEVVRNLDPTLKEALLKAIDRLERQIAEESENESDEESSTTKEELLEESTQSNDKFPITKLHTVPVIKPEENFFKSLLENAVTPTKEVNKTKLIENNDEKILHVTDNQLPRSVSLENNEAVDKKNNIPTKSSIILIRRRTTTTTPSTTTTRKPAPTHNDDGENIEVVDKEDIKIFEAPLITAFTVQQGEKGSANKIIPIFEPPPPPPTIPSNSPTPQPLTDEKSNQPTKILLPTPLPAPPPIIQINSNPSQSVTESNSYSKFSIPEFIQPDAIEHQKIQQNQSYPHQEQILFGPSQQSPSIFPIKQSPPLGSSFNPATHSLNNFLLERQRILEEQILQLQFQARQQQEQIRLQQQILLQHQNQVKPTRNTRTNITVRPSLEIVPTVTQSALFEFNGEQQLPVKEPSIFRPNFLPPNQQQHRTSIQIQPSNQVNYIPQTHFIPPTPPVPLELSTFQQPPQRSFQTFSATLIGPVNQNPSASKISSSAQTLQRNRHFRQETGVGNVGFNNFIHQGQNSFKPSIGPGLSYEGHLQNLLFQPALNHGITSFAPQNIQFPGQFIGTF